MWFYVSLLEFPSLDIMRSLSLSLSLLCGHLKPWHIDMYPYSSSFIQIFSHKPLLKCKIEWAIQTLLASILAMSFAGNNQVSPWQTLDPTKSLQNWPNLRESEHVRWEWEKKGRGWAEYLLLWWELWKYCYIMVTVHLSVHCSNIFLMFLGA